MQETVKKDRDKYIGGSDIPVIMNLSPFKTRYELLLEKAGYKEDTFGGNSYTEYGNIMESKIRDYINKDLPDGFKFYEGKVETKGSVNPIGYRAHTDGDNGDTILEIKTTSTIHDTVDEYKIYLVQLLYYMELCVRDTGKLAVYERPENLSEDFEPERLHIYDIRIEDYEDLRKEISEAVISFKEDLEKVRENPFIEESELLPVDIPAIADRILAFEYQLSLMKEVEEKIKADKKRLKEAMESAGVKTWKTPNGYTVTLVKDEEDKVVEVTTFDTDRLKSEAPEIFLKFAKTETKLKKGKEGYVRITPPKKKNKEA